MPLLLFPISPSVPPPRPRLRRLSPPPPMAAVAPPPVTLLHFVSIGLPPPATDDFQWLDLFAFLNSPADSYQIPREVEEELEVEVGVEEELEREIERERERERARRAEHRRQRQVKAETEAWARAAEEYRGPPARAGDARPEARARAALRQVALPRLVRAAARRLRQGPGGAATEAGQARLRQVPARLLLLLLPADKVAVIVMHKMMGLLMSSKDGGGSVRVVQAAHCIGEAVEREFKVQAFFQKTRKKGRGNNEGENDPALEKEQAKCRKRFKSLVKRRKLSEAQKLAQQEIELEEWGTEAQVKLGTHLIELLLDSAFAQSPADQRLDSSPDIRPAFKHILRRPIVENGLDMWRFPIFLCWCLLKNGKAMIKVDTFFCPRILCGHMV